MILQVDPHSATPPYEQLRAQLAVMIGTGVLQQGERLPSIRQLATDLALAPGTVSRAYTELEREGLIQTRRGRHGTVVLGAPRPLADPDRERQLREAAQNFAIRAHQLGVDSAEALRYAQQAFAVLPP